MRGVCMKKEKGALAIEATISFTIFIVFLFMLLSIVKLSMVYITINDITSETAKRAAGMAYPLSYVNDYFDELVNTGMEHFNFTTVSSKALEIPAKDDRTSSVLQSFGIGITDSALNETGIKDFISNLGNKIMDNILKSAITFVSEKQADFLYTIYGDLIDETGVPINKDNIKIVFFTLPEPENYFKFSKDDIAEATGLPEEDISKDDVILVVDYNYKLVMPFFPAREFTIRSVAVERGWLKGGNHAVPSQKEGLDFSKVLGNNVYYTKSGNGKKYHNSASCVTLARSGNNVTAVSISVARKMGLKPCGLCKPDENK